MHRVLSRPEGLAGAVGRDPPPAFKGGGRWPLAAAILGAVSVLAGRRPARVQLALVADPETQDGGLWASSWLIEVCRRSFQEGGLGAVPAVAPCRATHSSVAQGSRINERRVEVRRGDVLDQRSACAKVQGRIPA